MGLGIKDFSDSLGGIWSSHALGVKPSSACCELRMLQCDRVQWITAADMPSCGQKRHTRWPATNASACNELRMRYSTRTSPCVLPEKKRISMRTCSSMEFETRIRLHKLSGFGKPRILCVNPGYLSKPYKNFGFGYVRYLYIYLSLSFYLSVYLSICLSMSLPIYFSICLDV